MSIITLAASRGSTAKTVTGARRYLLGLIRAGRRTRLTRPDTAPGHAQIRHEWRRHCAERMERGGLARLHMAGLPTREAWVRAQVAAGRIEMAYEQDRTAQHLARLIAERADHIRPRILMEAYGQPASTWRDPGDIYIQVAGRIIRLSRHEQVEWSDNRRKHWPVSSHVTRTAALLPVGWDDASPSAALRWSLSGRPSHWQAAEKAIEYEARGHWLDRILMELLGEDTAQLEINNARVAQRIQEAA